MRLFLIAKPNQHRYQKRVVSNMFNLNKKWLAFLMVVIMSGCSTTTPPQTTNYYLLESVAPKSLINSNTQIALSPIKLSDYLKSSNLHVKNDSGQVIYSQTDLWAEQPNKILWLVMQQSLENQTGHHVLASYDAPNNCAEIKIHINELSPSTTGDVVTSGRWFINAKGKTLRTNNFLFSGKIDNDGFAASNQVMANHLHQLASQLSEKIKSLRLCR